VSQGFQNDKRILIEDVYMISNCSNKVGVYIEDFQSRCLFLLMIFRKQKMPLEVSTTNIIHV
ncbi:hypothetical protein ACJX0J_023589, partial [Zea mays]